MDSKDSQNPAGQRPAGFASSSAGAATAPAPAAPPAGSMQKREASYARQIRLGVTRLLILLAVVFTARYLYWRTTETMNPAARWFFYAFLVAEVLNILEALLFYVTTWAPTRYRTQAPLEGRTVDVLIATYDEPLEMLRETALCSVGIRYPHKTFLLDDGNRPQVKQLAEELGCGYIARTERTHAKAGNLNNALKQITGEFVVTLDADHVPSPDLIDQLIGFFRDDKVGAVQTAQDFYNLDSFQHRMNWRSRIGWQQQELFFNVIQPGKDRFNAAFFCGSPAILRRSALNDVGGFATETITEDMHTGLRLQKKKHKLIYHNQTLAFGLAPQTYLSYSTQWQRWGYGCMQVARAEKPVFGRGLSFGQRLCYFSSVYFYWMSYQKLLFLLTPIVALLTGAFPLVTTPEKFLSYFLPFFVLNVAASAMLQGGLRSYIRSEQFNILKMHVLLSTIKGLFRSTAAFKVTPKARSNAASLSDVLLPTALCVLMIAAMVQGARSLTHTTNEFIFWALSVNIVWAAFYLFMMGSVVLTALRRKEQRMSYRFPARLDLPVTARVKNSTSADDLFTGFARNLNRSGLSFTLDKAVEIGTTLTIDIRFPARTIQADGEVVRHGFYKLGKTTRVANGIRFTRIDPKDQDDISKFLFWQIAPQESAALTLTSLSQRED